MCNPIVIDGLACWNLTQDIISELRISGFLWKPAKPCTHLSLYGAAVYTQSKRHYVDYGYIKSIKIFQKQQNFRNIWRAEITLSWKLRQIFFPQRNVGNVNQQLKGMQNCLI